MELYRDADIRTFDQLLADWKARPKKGNHEDFERSTATRGLLFSHMPCISTPDPARAKAAKDAAKKEEKAKGK